MEYTQSKKPTENPVLSREGRAAMKRRYMCLQLSNVADFDVAEAIDEQMKRGSSIADATRWLRAQPGMPSNLIEGDIVRIIEVIGDRRRRARNRAKTQEQRKRRRAKGKAQAEDRKRRRAAAEEAALIRSAAGGDRRSAWIGTTSTGHIREVRGGLPSLGKRR